MAQDTPAMNLQLAFRFLILLEVVIAFSGSVIPGQSQEPANAAGTHASLFAAVFAVTVVVLWIVAIVGLWRFKRWSRALYVAVACASLLMKVVPPYYLPSSALDNLISSVQWLGVGALIALMYHSSLAARFVGRSPAA